MYFVLGARSTEGGKEKWEVFAVEHTLEKAKAKRGLAHHSGNYIKVCFCLPREIYKKFERRK